MDTAHVATGTINNSGSIRQASVGSGTINNAGVVGTANVGSGTINNSGGIGAVGIGSGSVNNTGAIGVIAMAGDGLSKVSLAVVNAESGFIGVIESGSADLVAVNAGKIAIVSASSGDGGAMHAVMLESETPGKPFVLAISGSADAAGALASSTSGAIPGYGKASSKVETINKQKYIDNIQHIIDSYPIQSIKLYKNRLE